MAAPHCVVPASSTCLAHRWASDSQPYLSSAWPQPWTTCLLPLNHPWAANSPHLPSPVLISSFTVILLEHLPVPGTRDTSKWGDSYLSGTYYVADPWFTEIYSCLTVIRVWMGLKANMSKCGDKIGGALPALSPGKACLSPPGRSVHSPILPPSVPSVQ